MPNEEETNYRDRNDGYVPTPRFGDLNPHFNVLVGNPYNDRHITTIVPVAIAEPDELNRRSDFWEWAQVDPGSADGTKEHWSHFKGWDVRIGVDLRTWNYREVHDWKGIDEIRPVGEWKLYFNDQLVHGDSVGRDVGKCLLKINNTIEKLRSLWVDWRKEDYRSQIEGRRIYYRDQPAVLYHWMPDQGCVMAKAVGCRFRSSAYDIDHQTGTKENPEHNYSEECEHEVKIELLSPDIWPWRERKFGNEE